MSLKKKKNLPPDSWGRAWKKHEVEEAGAKPSKRWGGFLCQWTAVDLGKKEKKTHLCPGWN